jgi:urea transport system substrate-binding protein
VKNPTNVAFIKEWHDYIKNPKRVTNDPMEATYIGIKMWAQAVEQARSTNVDAVRQAVGFQKVRAPSGFDITMDAKNHHLHKPVFIGEVKSDGQFNVVWKTPGPVKAKPWSPFIEGNDKKKDEPDGKSKV